MQASAPSFQNLQLSSITLRMGIKKINFPLAGTVAQKRGVATIQFKFIFQCCLFVQKMTLFSQCFYKIRTEPAQTVKTQSLRLFDVYSSRQYLTKHMPLTPWITGQIFFEKHQAGMMNHFAVWRQWRLIEKNGRPLDTLIIF